MRHRHASSVALIVLFLLAAGCAAGGFNATRQTIATAAQVQTEAHRLLEKYDENHQAKIVDEARKSGNLAEGSRRLEEYRQKRKGAIEALQYAGHATLMANALLPLVESGVNKEKELDEWLLKIAESVGKIYQAFRALGWDRIGLGGQL